MVAFEAQYTQRQGLPNPSYAMVAANLPAVVQRGLLAAEVDLDDAKARRWGASWRVMMDLLRRMHAAGIPHALPLDCRGYMTLDSVVFGCRRGHLPPSPGHSRRQPS